ncbi:hypothetical protein F5X96DRAFT_617234 [Biscogniauxia mediterranea]|nr:hypothetical protein F5X96DRAFT_617234 [Biscogniauxia mediterranea]
MADTRCLITNMRHSVIKRNNPTWLVCECDYEFDNPFFDPNPLPLASAQPALPISPQRLPARPSLRSIHQSPTVSGMHVPVGTNSFLNSFAHARTAARTARNNSIQNQPNNLDRKLSNLVELRLYRAEVYDVEMSGLTIVLKHYNLITRLKHLQPMKMTLGKSFCHHKELIDYLFHNTNINWFFKSMEWYFVGDVTTGKRCRVKECSLDPTQPITFFQLEDFSMYKGLGANKTLCINLMTDKYTEALTEWLLARQKAADNPTPDNDDPLSPCLLDDLDPLPRTPTEASQCEEEETEEEHLDVFSFADLDLEIMLTFNM